MKWTHESRLAWLKAEAQRRILLLDGSWGVMIQGCGLSEADFRGRRFADHGQDLKGNIDVLTLTRPDLIREIGVFGGINAGEITGRVLQCDTALRR